MAKPIFIVGIPDTSPEKLSAVNKTLTAQLSDYHVLVYPIRGSAKEPIFQAFYAKDLIETDFASFKKLATSMMNGEKMGII